MSRTKRFLAIGLVFGILWFLAGAVVWAVQKRAQTPPIRAYLEIALEPPKLLFETAAWAQEARIPFDLVVQGEMIRLKLDRVLRNALASLEASGKTRLAALRGQKPPLDWLKENLVVTATGNFLAVGLRGDLAAADQVAVINAVVDAYIVDSHEEREDQRAKVEELKHSQRRYEVELRNLRGRVRELLRMGIDPTDGAGSIGPEELDRLAELTLADLARVESELRVARAEKAARAPGGDDGTLDRRIAALGEQVRLTREDASSYARVRPAGESAPEEVAGLRDEIRLLEEMYRDVGHELMRLEFERDAPDRVKIADLAMPTAP